ncbi:hypothetical protein NIES4103_16260 [Nostoc sp. NIES-4103]|nr:hypothetical protein NIES4103_16260 [Nostoc sp. NIES-4103]
MGLPAAFNDLLITNYPPGSAVPHRREPPRRGLPHELRITNYNKVNGNSTVNLVQP